MPKAVVIVCNVCFRALKKKIEILKLSGGNQITLFQRQIRLIYLAILHRFHGHVTC